MINGPVQSGDLFIFYGLLKSGARGAPEHIDLKAGGAFVGPCRFRGRLIDLGGFPGVVDGDTLCHGQIYRLDDAGLIGALDEFEGVDAGDPGRSLYIRDRIDILDDDAQLTGQSAWIYWYAKPAGGAPDVAEGNWPLEAGKARI